MANLSLFASIAGKLLARADALNRQQAPAYRLAPEQALAQLAATGTFNGTFYAEPREQLEKLLALAAEVEPLFLAKTAVYAAETARMKDMPAVLLALLSSLPGDGFARAFPRVIGNGKMLRNFVQIMRSGAVGRKSLGTRPKALVKAWLETASDLEIMRAAVGNNPSLADVIKMVHPRPADAGRRALYGYLLGKPYDVAALPPIAASFEAFKRDLSLPTPPVPFQMLTALPLERRHWIEIAETASWQMLRQNLAAFARRGVFEVEGFARRLAARLADPVEIRRARAFPYQLMAAWSACGRDTPPIISEALHEAMETAIDNVPCLDGRIVLAPDVSASMASPITGHRKGATSRMRCIDVAALTAAAILRRNRQARLLPFESDVVDMRLDASDSIFANAAKLAAVAGGGTNCAAPLARLVRERAKVDLVVMISDNQSWVDAKAWGATAVMENWQRLKVWNPGARLVAIDIQPYLTTQAIEREDILNVGGFSDAVFDVISAFAAGQGPGHWVRTIDAVDI